MVIFTHEGQVPHGSSVGPLMQFSDLAKILADDVLQDYPVQQNQQISAGGIYDVMEYMFPAIFILLT